MFENVTFEAILEAMLDRVPNTLDKREGSIIYDALAPAAAELQNAYIALDMVLNEGFADTASWQFLVRRCAERGIYPAEATAALMQGEFTPASLEIPAGSRFSGGNLNYVVEEKTADGTYKLRCETAGIAGHAYLGPLIPIDYMEGLETAALTEILIPGEDEEDEDSLRARYYASFDSAAYGGNVADYKEKVSGLPGVGGVKVYPVWNGGGTVKLVVMDSNYQVPSSTLVAQVQEAVDPSESPGTGQGVAPIGHVVTVAGVTSAAVNIVTEITYQSGWTWEDIRAYAESTMDSYFAELAASWAGEDHLIVRISQIETRLLDLAGVLDIGGTTINGTAQNLVLGADEIPVRGVVSDGG